MNCIHVSSFEKYDHILTTVNIIRSKILLKETPKIGLICGSGLGSLAECLHDNDILPYKDIPGFLTTKVQRHKGNLLFGYICGKYVACLQGRFHPFEFGMNIALCFMPIRVLKELGMEILIISNAAGGVNSSFRIGDLNPLIGVHDPRMGSRFVCMKNAFDRDLGKIACKVAEENGFVLRQGVYVMTCGPQFETPAEAKMLKLFGADAIGMSTCYEVTVARQLGVRVVGFSLIANIVNPEMDDSTELTHEQVLATGKKAEERSKKLVKGIVANI